MLLVREKPPTRLSVDIQTPSGAVARWGGDDSRPDYQPQALTFDTTMPGGWDTGSCTLERDPRRSYPDVEELSTVTVRGLGGSQIAYQGRIEGLPDVGGAQSQLNPQFGGWQNHLKDNTAAREIFIDCLLSNWQGASVQRQINILAASVDETDASSSADQSGQPALITQLTGTWVRTARSEGWYDAKGIPIGDLYYAWKLQTAGTIGDDSASDANWSWAVDLADNDVASAYDAGPNLRGNGPGTGVLAATTASRLFALVGLQYNGGAGGSGVNYPVFWTYLGVVGRHGCPIKGALTATGGIGILASDAIAYAVGKWAPKLAFTTGASGTIQPSAFVLPQLAFTDPTTVQQMITQMVAYELLDWAVWEGPSFYLNPRGTSVKTRNWRARIGEAQLQDTGASINRLFNGVIVQYTDVTGVTRYVGPPGSGCAVTDPSLLDQDPENPANQAGIDRWALLTAGTLGSVQTGATPPTSPAAIQLGSMYLQEQKLADTSGQAAHVGHVQDDKGVWWPTWMMRAGDTVTYVDSSNPVPRRIVSTSYTDADVTNQVQLDQPPQTVEALLSQVSEAVAPYGFS